MHASKQHAAPQTPHGTQLLPTPQTCSSANSFEKIRFPAIEIRLLRRHVQFRSQLEPDLIAMQQEIELRFKFHAKDINHDFHGVFKRH